MSRAAVERTPGRAVRPGVSAATWWGDPRDVVLPTRPPPPAVMTMETLDRVVQMLKDAPGPPPGAMVVPPWVAREAARFASGPYYPDALALAWGIDWSADVVRERERRAVERTGRALVAWLIGRWRR